MKIFLLTHQCELGKRTNTGYLVIDVLGSEAEVIVWERKSPSAALLDCIADGSTALLYPSNDSESISSDGVYQYYIVIDGTWQEANKIYNRSPYLHELPKVAVRSNQPSAYRLRRNQKPGGLCTAECVVELLKDSGLDHKAAALSSAFERFQAFHR